MHDFDGVPADLRSRHGTRCGRPAHRSSSWPSGRIACRDCVPLLDLGAQSARRRAASCSSAWATTGRPPASLPRPVRVGVDVCRHDPRHRAAGRRTMLSELQLPAGLTRQHATLRRRRRTVAHSVSPSMHNAAFRALRFDAVYLPLPAPSADDFVDVRQAVRHQRRRVTDSAQGARCSIASTRSTRALAASARSTRIRVEGGRWIGSNTDAGGFLEPLQRTWCRSSGLRVSVLGAGGAARAVADALASSRARCASTRAIGRGQTPSRC